MPLHPQAKQYLERVSDGRPPQRTPTKVQDLNAGSVPVRVYTPSGLEDPLPALLYFHGGGFTGGSIDGGDTGCRVLAEFAGIPVQLKRYAGMVHAFAAAYREFDAATELALDSARALQKALS